MDAVEIPEAVLQNTEPHGGLHHINALQLEVIHGVKGCYATGVSLCQSKQLLCRRGDGLTGRVKPKGQREVMKIFTDNADGCDRMQEIQENKIYFQSLAEKESSATQTDKYRLSHFIRYTYLS